MVIFLVSALILFPLFVSPGAARGPRGDTAVRGPEGNIAVGTRVNTLPATATPVVVGGTNYYVDGKVYYKADYSSGGVVYVVVPAPQY